jgi:hypothetical protein
MRGLRKCFFKGGGDDDVKDIRRCYDFIIFFAVFDKQDEGE